MAKLILSEKIPPNLQSKINIVKKRILFLSPSVTDGQEHEAKKEDFEALTSTSIGTGGFGKVYKVRHKISQNIYAIKVISKAKIIESKLCEQIKLEVRIMYALNHEHVIKLYNHFEDDDYFYLLLEFAPNGHLYEKLKSVGRFREREAAQYLREVMSAVEYLHSLNPPIIHRDIKPENILLDPKEALKLCDFGWSNFFNPTRERKTYCGTPDYLSPEMIRQDGHDQRLDLWNLGVLLFEMLTGRPPFQGTNQKELFENILKLKITYPKDFPKLAKDLVSKLLKSKPAERISLKEALEHAWFKSNPEIRPVLTRKVEAEQKLPTLEADIKEDEYEPVTRVSKVNREGIKKQASISIKDDQLKGMDEKQKKTDKDIQIDTLATALEAKKQELAMLKGAHQASMKEVEALKKENEEYKQHLGSGGKGYVPAYKQEITKLNEELSKLKAINKSRDELVTDLDKKNASLLEALAKVKLLENEIEGMARAKLALEEKNKELVNKLEATYKKCDGIKQQLEENNLSKEKSKAELEVRIDELRYKLSSKPSHENIGEMAGDTLTDIAELCKKLLGELKEKITAELNFKKMGEEAQEKFLAEHQRCIEMEKKYLSLMDEYSSTMTRTVEEIRRKCEKEKREELEKKDKAIEDLDLQISQIEAQEGKVEIETHNIESIQKQNLQLQKQVNELKMQSSLSGKEAKHLREKEKEYKNKLMDLEYKLDQKKDKEGKDATKKK